MADTGAAADRQVARGLPPLPEPPLPIAISQCLLGSAVRYDGSAAGFALPHAALAGLLSYRGICPEEGIGLGTPREPIGLVGDRRSPRVLGVARPELDVTDALRAFGREQAARLDDVVGYVFMRGSPSCGLFDVKVHARQGGAAFTRDGRGAYAAAVTAARPDLPVEENGRLHDPLLRETFLVRVFAYAHWRALEQGRLSRDRLAEFHRRYELLLMAHDVTGHEALGALLDQPAAYLRSLMGALSRPAGRRGHVRVLAHARRRLGERCGDGAAHPLESLARGYGRGTVPLAEPVARIRELARQVGAADLERQVYLDLYADRLLIVPDGSVRR